MGKAEDWMAGNLTSIPGLATDLLYYLGHSHLGLDHVLA